MSEDNEDWFERALRESEETESSESESNAETGTTADAEGEPDADSAPDSGAFEDFGADADVDSNGDDDSPFDQDFASAFESAPDIEASGSSGDDGFGGGGGQPGLETGPEGPGGDPFDAEDVELDSAIERLSLGIEGLDNMILGGVPTRSLISIIGSAGTGKTTFGLQFLHEALSNGQRGVYISLEESTDRIYDTAAEKGWSFREYADEGQLAVVHLDPVEMANSLSSIRNELPELIKEFGADRLVLDSVSLLEMMYERPSDRRSEVYQFSKSLKEAGVTTLVTSEASSENPYNSRYGIIEYLADAVFVLQYVRASDFQETRLAVEIQKIRDANHSRETKPYEITNNGMSVYRQANIF